MTTEPSPRPRKSMTTEPSPRPTENGMQQDDWQIDYTYDNNGKLLSSSRNSCPDSLGYTSDQESYTYDVWGRLTGYSNSLGKTASYSYYSDGLRSQKNVDNTTIKYYYNGDDVINETKDGSNFATNVMGADGPISRQYSGYEHYYYKNIHGDVIFAFTNNHWHSSEYIHSAYGEEKKSYDYFSSNPNPIRYVGEYYDTESGMTYLRARYYDPFQRRFISEDPIKDGVNWYAYCGNNPVMFVDPSGLEMNTVSEFINNYGATRLHDNYEEGYTMVELNGFQQKIYWNPVNNTNAYAIDSYNIEGSLAMERQDFLCLFGIEYEVVRIDYNIDLLEAAGRNGIIGIAGGAGNPFNSKLLAATHEIANFLGLINVVVESGYYSEEWFYVKFNGDVYYTHTQNKSSNETVSQNIAFSNDTWNASLGDRRQPSMQNWYEEKCNLGYVSVKR